MGGEEAPTGRDPCERTTENDNDDAADSALSIIGIIQSGPKKPVISRVITPFI